MKLLFIATVFFVFPVTNSMGNNIQVNNVRLTGQNTTDDFTIVEFDISWENSWRYDNGPVNWDAAWVFVKYRLSPGGSWNHAWLNNTGHIACNNTSISNGLLIPELSFHVTSNPVIGVFLFRSSNGTGFHSCQDVQLRWNYGANTVVDIAQVEIKVFAIEMVYIPQGNFHVGSGGTEVGAFYTYPNTTAPFTISSEAAITVGTQTGNLYYNNPTFHAGDQNGPIPAAYPKGYLAFYAMKYELSQFGYVEFLNTLTRAQQNNRVRSDLTSMQPPNVFVMAAWPSPLSRNGIRCRSLIAPAPARVEFFCDLNNNGIANENEDGLCIPVNYVNYGDLAGYLDWAGLRPMTEFEFEKCGRGPVFPTPNEYAWGSQDIHFELGVQNSGSPTEIPSEAVANASFTNCPIRCGSFAREQSSRQNAGAGYYGCTELTGNLFEMAVSVGIPHGRSYTGNHGNGLIDLNGNADVSNWPLIVQPFGFSYRGGSGSINDPKYQQLSNREFAALQEYYSSVQFGIRGVRKG